MIKVLLADDHQMFLDGLRAVLDHDASIEIVGEALDGTQVLDKLEEVHQELDIVVLDVRMPKMDGVEATKEIIRLYPAVKVLILSMHNRKHYILQLMEIGISGYVLKNRSKEDLVQAIHSIHDGKPYYSLDVLSMISTRDPEEKGPISPLTEREIEVLCKIAEAKTTRQISEELHISEATVNTHRRNLLLKLNKSNDKHLVRYAIKMGYISL
ncbi:MAG: response regulator transcription factor [Bacteroidota bacterium]